MEAAVELLVRRFCWYRPRWQHHTGDERFHYRESERVHMAINTSDCRRDTCLRYGARDGKEGSIVARAESSDFNVRSDRARSFNAGDVPGAGI